MGRSPDRKKAARKPEPSEDSSILPGRRRSNTVGSCASSFFPLITSAFYLFAIAADQYESEAEFMVKTASQTNGGYNSSFAQMFGLSGALNPSQSDSLSVGDYLTSHDAVAALGHQMDLVAMFRRSEADFLSRLWDDSPSPERLLKYYRRQMAVALQF